MFSRKVHINKQAYTFIFLLDLAIQKLFDWVYNGPDKMFDVILHQYLRQKLKDKLEKKLKYNNETSENNCTNMLGKSPTDPYYPWVLNDLLFFIENFTKEKKTQKWDGWKCFRNDKKIATQLAGVLSLIIDQRNEVMHSRIFSSSIELLASQCDQVITQLRLYIFDNIEKEECLQLLTATKGELCYLAGITEHHQQNKSTIEYRQLQLEFIETWYLGYGNSPESRALGRGWPIQDIPKLVTAKAMKWSQIAYISQMSIEDLNKSLDIPVSADDEVILEDLRKVGKKFPEEILDTVRHPLPSATELAWSAYRPDHSKGDLLGRHVWVRNKEHYAYLVLWEKH